MIISKERIIISKNRVNYLTFKEGDLKLTIGLNKNNINKNGINKAVKINKATNTYNFKKLRRFIWQNFIKSIFK